MTRVLSHLKGTMDTTDPSRFSHITIGQGADGTESSEEEIELIGAVELVEATILRGEPEQLVSPVTLAEGDSPESIDSEDRATEPLLESSRQQDKRLDDTIDSDEQPMLLARKITLALCGLGVIVAAVYILNYWGVINLPF